MLPAAKSQRSWERWPSARGSRLWAGASLPGPLPSCLGWEECSARSPQRRPHSASATVPWEHPAAHDSARPSRFHCSCLSRPKPGYSHHAGPCLGGKTSPSCRTTLCLGFLTGEATDMLKDSNEELLG